MVVEGSDGFVGGAGIDTPLFENDRGYCFPVIRMNIRYELRVFFSRGCKERRVLSFVNLCKWTKKRVPCGRSGRLRGGGT